MKKIFSFLSVAMVMGISITTTSCDDILEVESDRQVFDPALDGKTDSVYYTLGIMKGLQQLADQYVLTNELRGDLLQPTEFADSALTQLFEYSATTANKYDSAYVYYRVINNCNYYITHRDTSLMTGSYQVAMPEYVEALTVRAWCYLQLAKTYGSVPFFTKPLQNISDANSVTDMADIQRVYAEFAPDLRDYTEIPVPNYGDIDAYGGKTVPSPQIMLKAQLVLADLALEAGRYEEAATQYFDYLRKTQTRLSVTPCTFIERMVTDPSFDTEKYPEYMELTNSERSTYYYPNYPLSANIMTTASTFTLNPLGVYTYIPMAVNRLQGTTSALPELFGYDLYTLDADKSIEEHALNVSNEYIRLSDAQPYYYYDKLNKLPKVSTMGDMRRWVTTRITEDEFDNTKYHHFITKFEGANVILHRPTVIYLRLAEAINRMGYPDAAFSILKDGLGNIALNAYTSSDTTYTSHLSPKAYEMLNTTLPFFAPANRTMFFYSKGVHGIGSGYTEGRDSRYQFKEVVHQKLAELKEKHGLQQLPDSIIPYFHGDSILLEGDTVKTFQYIYNETGFKELAIEIVEDLICDELALEAAFEGHRFGDLCRMARSKNNLAPAAFGANWGGRWMKAKTDAKFEGTDMFPKANMSVEANWYLPFK